jgi:AcrR family transcriptional regulator
MAAPRTPVRPRQPRRPRAIPARYRSAPPVQSRSRETLDRLAEAVESLLLTRSFEDIPVQDIVDRAGSSVGSFYARFGSKEALLPHLYLRYHDRLEDHVRAHLRRVDWDRLDFPDTVVALVDLLLSTYDERRELIRVLALFARQHPDALPADVVAHRRRIYEPFVRILLRYRDSVVHADPEAAIQFGIFFASSLAREKILFADAPHSRVTPLSREALRRESSRALLSYLTCEVTR